MKPLLQRTLLGLFFISSLSEASLTEFSLIENNSLTEVEFNEVVDRIERIYFNNHREEKIEVQRFWECQGEHDCAIRFPYLTLEKPVVKITGTVARSEGMTSDAFAIVVCHEFGHHLASGPRIGSRHLVSWSSAEGEADYWATANCLKQYFSKPGISEEQNGGIEFSIPADAAEKCQNQFSDENDRQICIRSVRAILNLKTYFEANGSRIDLSTPTPKTVGLVRRFRRDIYRDQCRIETFLAGAYCNSKNGPCETGDGARPSCWFALDELPEFGKPHA